MRRKYDGDGSNATASSKGVRIVLCVRCDPPAYSTVIENYYHYYHRVQCNGRVDGNPYRPQHQMSYTYVSTGPWNVALRRQTCDSHRNVMVRRRCTFWFVWIEKKDPWNVFTRIFPNVCETVNSSVSAPHYFPYSRWRFYFL